MQIYSLCSFFMIAGIVFGVLITKESEVLFSKECMKDYAWRHQIKLDDKSIQSSVNTDYANAAYFKKYYNVERKVDLPDHINNDIYIDQTNGPIIYVKDSLHQPNLETNRLNETIKNNDRWFYDIDRVVIGLRLEKVDKIGWYMIYAVD